MHDTDHDLVHNERIGYYSNMWTERIHIMHTLASSSTFSIHTVRIPSYFSTCTT